MAWVPTRPNSGFSLDAAVRVGARDRARPYSEQETAATSLCSAAVRAGASGAVLLEGEPAQGAQHHRRQRKADTEPH